MKQRATRNKTLTLTDDEIPSLKKRLITLPIKTPSQNSVYDISQLLDKTIHGDVIDSLSLLPDEFADLIIIDPPYNLTKNFNGEIFKDRKSVV